MSKHDIPYTDACKLRLHKIWVRSGQRGAVFDRYDMNFVLGLLNGNTDLVYEACKAAREKAKKEAGR